MNSPIRSVWIRLPSGKRIWPMRFTIGNWSAAQRRLTGPKEIRHLVVVLVHFFGLAPWGGDGSSLGHAVELGALVAIAAPLGDLAESMIKRNLDIKDFGTVLPGHGGVLDRFDAFLFVLPAVYYLSIILEVG